MGSTIHYRLYVPRRLARAVVRDLVERTALYARKIGCAEVSEVMQVEADTPGTFWHVLLERHGERTLRSIPANRGWVVNVWPGEGCESALFGLCQYPVKTPHITCDVLTGAGSGWDFKGYCKATAIAATARSASARASCMSVASRMRGVSLTRQ